MQQLPLESFREWVLFVIALGGAAAAAWAMLIRPVKRRQTAVQKEQAALKTEFEKVAFDLRTDQSTQYRKLMDTEFEIRSAKDSLERIETMLEEMRGDKRGLATELASVDKRLGIIENIVKRLEAREDRQDR